MKNILKLTMGPLVVAGFCLIPTPAQAELLCIAPPYSNSDTSSVQNANQCSGEKNVLLDSSTGITTDPKTGKTLYLPYDKEGAQKALDCEYTNGVNFNDCAKAYGYLGAKTDAQATGAKTPSTSPTTPAPAAKPNIVVTNPNVQTIAQSSITNPNAFCQGGKCTYTPLEPLPGLPTSYGPNTNQGSFQQYVSSSFKLLLGAGVTLAVVMLIIGALTYMFSDVVPDKFKAKERIRNTMWGLIILVSSYLILSTINPDLVTFKLNLGPLTVPAGTQPSASSPIPGINNRVTVDSVTLGDIAAGDNAQRLQQFVGQCQNKAGSVIAVGGNSNSTSYECISPKYNP